MKIPSLGFCSALVFLCVPFLKAQELPRFSPNEVIIRVKQKPQFTSDHVSPQQFHQLNADVAHLLAKIPARSARPLFGLANTSSARFNLSFQAADSARFLEAWDQQNRTLLVTLEEGVDVLDVVDDLSNDPEVEFVEPNFYYWPSATIPNDANFSLQWGLRNTGQSGTSDFDDPSDGTAGDDIESIVAWDTQTGQSSMVVAVIDTGLDWDHPDIEDNVWSNSEEASGSAGVDDDGNGQTDDVRGWDFGSNDNDPDDTCSNLQNPFLDSGGHGTHVSGILGAVGNNGVGVSGVNWTVSIMPVKVADDNCEIDSDALSNAIIYAAENGAKVINMSLGGPHAASMESAVNTAEALDVISVAAAGNSGVSSIESSYPAAYDNVIAVAATDRNDQKASFSNFGSWIAISAPGVAIYSTYPVPDGSYIYSKGTSMACPMVVGAVALIRAQYPSLNDSETIERLLAGAENIDAENPSYVDQLGSGRLNIARSLMSVTSVSPTEGLAPLSVALSVTGVSIVSDATLSLKRGSETIGATGVSVPNSTTINGTLNLSGAEPGLWDVVVTAGNMVQTLSNGFNVETIVITSVDPSTAPITSNSTQIAITGENFTADMVISLTRSGFTSLSATTQTINSDTLASATFDLTQAEIGGRWDVTLTKSGSTYSLEDGFGIITSAFVVVNVDPTEDNTFTVDSVPGVQTVTWPANTVDQAVVLDVDGQPVLPEVNASLDPYRAAGSGLELVANPSTINFSNSFTITLTYRVSDLADPTKEDALLIGVYNTTTGRWEPLISLVDTVAKTVTATIDHLSIFAIIQHVPSLTLNNIVAFPNPYRSDRHSQKRISFDFLTAGARVRIYDMAGELVRDLSDSNNDGIIQWGLDTEGGSPVASGMYLYLVTDSSGNKEVGKVGVMR